MEKSELRQIIREEIQRITEGGDLILLKSIDMLIDQYSGDLYPTNLNFMYGHEVGSKSYKHKMSKLDSKDKKIVKALDLNEDWRKELDKQESFELGTPVVYKDRNKEYSGEVTMNKKPVKNASGSISKPGTVQGISLYPFRGTQTTFIVPDSWFKVKKF